MFDIQKNINTLVEIASIAGIMAFFYWMDRSFGILNWIVTELNTSFPEFKNNILSLAAIGFIGLFTYSFMQRYKTKSERKNRLVLEDILKKQNFTDASTGLANRDGFKIMFANLRNSEIMTSKSIIAFEIRNLDTIASVHGEQVVNEIENLYAETLKQLCRENDFAAKSRRGRFYLLINSLNEPDNYEQVENVLNKIKAVSASGFKINGAVMSVQTNLAWLNLNKHSKIAATWGEDDIVRRLDYLLFTAKDENLERVRVYSTEMEDSLNLRILIESELLDALRSGEIVPYYQPFIDMKSNKVKGFEILARWNHPQKGFIPPNVFIDIAEDIGAMNELTLTMLGHACFAARNWPEDMKLAFNISPDELRNDATMDGFFKILQETGISANRIEIEITENAFIDEVGEISEAILRLKNRGIIISIDDFGTGFANFSHLKMLPFDKIKIDQSFVRDMGSNANSKVIVKNIIALGKSLGLPTVAEGIELADNRQCLQELGCSIGQGYLYAKALDAKSVPGFLENYETEIIELSNVA